MPMESDMIAKVWSGNYRSTITVIIDTTTAITLYLLHFSQ